MEDNGGISPSGVTVKGDEAPDSYCIAPRTKYQNPNPSPFLGPTTVAPPPTTAATAAPQPTTAVPPPVSSATPPSATGTVSEVMKKKRGRPRKYGPDGTLTPEAAAAAAAAALSPMPISSSVPLAGDFSGWKRGRGRTLESIKKSHKFEFERPSDGLAYFVGANFTPHVMTVHAGEDVTMKVMSFSQRGSRAICVLSANGTVSSVTLRQPNTSGGTLTYEGRFEILSLCGSFMPTENGGTRSQSGGMSVSLAGSDGHVLGGGLAGLLVAAGTVQVIVGSFIVGHQAEHRQKKPKVIEASTPPAFTITTVNTISAEDLKQSYGGIKTIQTPSCFHIDSSSTSAMNRIVQAYTNSNAENIKESSSFGEESRGTTSQTNCELSS